MGSNKSPSHIRGLLIPDPRFSFAGAFDTTNSVYTEKTPRPGVPIAKDDSDLILETSGESTGDLNLTVYTQNSGYPENLGGTFLYSDTSSTSTYKHYGWEPPHTINGLERVDSGNNSSHYINYDTVTTLDDTLIIAGVHSTSGFMRIWHKGPNATAWTEVDLPYFLEPGMQLVVGNRAIDGTSDGTTTEGTVGTEPGPALVVLPSGRVLCFFWIQTANELTATATNTSKRHWQIQAVFSDDSGASWAMYQNFCLIEPLSQLADTRSGSIGRYWPGRLRAEYKDGQILMISSAYDSGAAAQGGVSFPGNVYLQFASSSLGASFVLVEKNTKGATSDSSYDIAVSGGKFVVSYLVTAGSGNAIPYTGFLGSAFSPMSRSDRAFVPIDDYGGSFAELLAADTGNAAGRADLAICAVPDGSMYMVGVRHGHDSVGYTKNSVALMFSGDNGETWSMVGGQWGGKDPKKDGTIYSSRFYDEPSSAGAHARDTLRSVAITWQRGRLAVACRFEDSPASGTIYVDGDRDHNVSCLYLGGYSNLTIGSIDAAISMADRGTYAKHYLPFVEPADMLGAWTVTTAGSSVSKGIAVNGAEPYLKLSTTSAEYTLSADVLQHTSTQNTRTESATWGGPMLSFVEFAVEIISGGNDASPHIAMILQNGNADGKTRVGLYFRAIGDTTRVSVYDATGAASLHSETITFSTAANFGEYRVATVGRAVTVWYREYSAAAEERTWIKLYQSQTEELSVAVSAGFCKLQWGHITSSTAHSRWYKVQAGAHDGDLNHCAVPRLNDWMGYASPANVGGRFFSPSQIYLNTGLQIAAKDGPAVKGDEWDLSPRFDYPVEAVHHEISPSPAKDWRSSGRSVAAELIWNIDTADPAMALGGSRALYLGGINFRYCLLKGYNGTSWDTIATIDAAQQVRYHRRGNSLTAYSTGISTAQTGDRVWSFDGMAGCTFNFQDTGAPALYNISANSEGVFEAGATKPPVFIVDGTVSGEPTTGDGQIWCKDLCVYIPDNVVTAYERLKIEIPVDVPGVTGSGNNKTISGDWHIGTVIWGHVAVFGRQYSRGHIRSIEPNTELFTATGGQRRAVEQGPARRAVEFSWVDPVDISAMGDTLPSPDYIQTIGSGAIVASVENTPFLIQGLLSRLKGSVVPVVYLPSVPVGTSAAFQIDDRNRFLYGRIVTASHRIENQIGDEWIGGGTGEAVTATAIRIEEEL